MKKILGLALFSLCVYFAVSFSAYAEEYESVATTTWNGHTYALYDNEISWTTAKNYCESIGGYLTTITSSEEQNTIFDLVISGNRKGYYLGGTDSSSEGHWSWVTGEKWDYSMWSDGEPNNDRNEDYLHIASEKWFNTNAGRWNDTLHYFGNIGFICEWDYEWNTGKSGITYFTPEEARVVIGFFYNTNHLTEEMLNSSDMFEFLTGQKQGSPDEEIYKRLFLATSYDLISQNIDSASSKAKHGYDTLLNSLLEFSNLSDDQTSVDVNVSLGDIKTAFISTLSMALGADHVEVKALEELFSGVTDLAGLKGKASDIVTKFEACMGAAELLNNAAYRDMYTYYKAGLDMKPIYGYSDDLDAFLDAVFVDFNKSSSFAGNVNAMIDKIDFTGLTDRFNLNWTSDEYISFLDELSNFTYMVELSLFDSSNENNHAINQQSVITFDSNSEYSDDFTYVYTPKNNNWQIPELKRNGYKIDSWYWDEELTELISGTITIKDKIKFFAKWFPIFELLINDSAVTIAKLNIEDEVIEIPKDIDGCLVESITEKAFENCSHLSKITIPNSVTKIAENAFEDCLNLSINGYKYSAAQYYAKEHGLPFVDIAPDIYLGDVTGDKKHDISDFTEMVDLILKNDSAEIHSNQQNIDINADEKVSLNDLRLLMQIIAKENNIVESNQ